MANDFQMQLSVDLTPGWINFAPDLDNLVGQSAFQIERDAKIDCPRDTGTLANSIEARNESEIFTGAPDIIWTIGPSAEYGIFVELGTIYMRAQPYLFPAAEREEPRLQKAVQQLIKVVDRG